MSQLLTHMPGFTTLRFQEIENAMPGKHVRAVGMCFYGSGHDLDKSKWYELERNLFNVKDTLCIDVKDDGQIKAT